jgi:hypothetical protein
MKAGWASARQTFDLIRPSLRCVLSSAILAFVLAGCGGSSRALPTQTTADGTAAVTPAEPSATPTRSPSVWYPDPVLTPGDVLPVGRNEICVPGYARRTRNVPLVVRRSVLAAYNWTAPSRTFELDHLISLELGGSNDPKNLFPEPYEPRPGAHEKDQLENKLHELVCDGDLELAAAQAMIVSDWYAAYWRFIEP